MISPAFSANAKRAPALFRVPGPDGRTETFDAAKGDVCLVLMHVEDEYANPRGWADRGNQTTLQVSRRISHYAPLFRKAGIPIVVVRSSRQNPLFKLKPEPGDAIEEWAHPSPLNTPETRHGKELADAGRKLLLYGGFNTSACVMRHVLDRKDAFSIALLEDLTGNDEASNREERYGGMRSLPAIQQLHEQGIFIAKAHSVMQSLLKGEAFSFSREMPPLSLHHVADAVRPLRPANPALYLGR